MATCARAAETGRGVCTGRGHSDLQVGHVNLPAGNSVLPIGHRSLPSGQSDIPVGHSDLPVGHSVLPVGHALPLVGQSDPPDAQGRTRKTGVAQTCALCYSGFEDKGGADKGRDRHSTSAQTLRDMTRLAKGRERFRLPQVFQGEEN